jgi:hypothetical protein
MTMRIESPKVQMPDGKAAYLLPTRSTVDVSLVNKELARSFQDLVTSIFKKRVGRSEERQNGE